MTFKNLLLVSILAICVSAVTAGQDAFPDPEDIRPLLPGTTIPDVDFTRLDGSQLSLSAAAASKPTVLIFYRGGW